MACRRRKGCCVVVSESEVEKLTRRGLLECPVSDFSRHARLSFGCEWRRLDSSLFEFHRYWLWLIQAASTPAPTPHPTTPCISS